MSGPATQAKPAPTRAATTAWAPWVVLGILCALVIGFYAGSARPGWLGILTWRAEDAYYNLLVRGFRAGQLDLRTEVPPGLAHLADPYDPSANADYLLVDGHPLWDLSYYHGKLFLYFGVTPALLLFWPYAALTGHYLWHKDAVVIFCATGFLASVGLLGLMWRRYFSEVGLGVVTAGALALGLAGFTPIILPRAEVFEVAISCGYALAMLALVALWGACHRPQQRGRWLATASLAYGLAVAARPTALFGAVILLVPVVQAWREGRGWGLPNPKSEIRNPKQALNSNDSRHETLPASRVGHSRIAASNLFRASGFGFRIWVLLLAAMAPITSIGLGLMLYNTLRFDNPLEFGTRYQLNDLRMSAQHFWSPHYLGINLWDYFLRPARWGELFPFVQDLRLPRMSEAQGYREQPFGVLTSIPLVWMAWAMPLAWRGRAAEARWILRGFLAAATLLFATRALSLGPFYAAFVRYEWEFCPVLVLLGVVGILSLERATAGWPAWRRAARWAWGLLLAFSLAFNLLASAIYHAEYHSKTGRVLVQRGQVNEGIAHYQKALVLRPDDAMTHYDLGSALGRKGQTDEAIRHYQEALRLKPDYAEAHNNLGGALGLKGQTDEAIHQFQETLRLKPEQAEAHYNLAVALRQKGQSDEAIRQLQETLRLRPEHVQAHNILGTLFHQQGRTGEAIREFREALRLKPDDAEARKNLIIALAAQSSRAPVPAATTNR